MKHYLLAVLVGTCAALLAQPVITGNVVTPFGTTSFYLQPRYGIVSSFNPGIAGDSVLWDFALLDTAQSTLITEQTIRADTTVYYENFPGQVNRALAYYGPFWAEYGYTYLDSAKYEFYGNSNPDDIFVYTDPQKILVFPFTYNDAYTDTYSTDNLSVDGTIHVHADAYGTLVLPGGTYTNVLRVITREFYRYDDLSDPNDSVFYDAYYYRWYQPNTPNVLLEHSSHTRIVFENGNRQDFPFAKYLYITVNPMATSIAELSSLKIAAYPNPAGNYLHANADATIETAELTDLSGKTVLQQRVYDKSAVFNIANITAGTYLLKLVTVDNRSKTIKIAHY